MAHTSHHILINRRHQTLAYEGTVNLVRIIFNQRHRLRGQNGYRLIEHSSELVELQIHNHNSTMTGTPLDVDSLRAALAATTHLEILEFVGCEFSNTTTAFVPAVVQQLSFRGCPAFPQMISKIPTMTALNSLNVSATGLRQVRGTADDQLQDLLDKIPNAAAEFTDLVISDNNSANHGCIDMIPSDMEGYEKLRLIDARNTAITQAIADDFIARWKGRFPAADHVPRVLTAGSRPC